MNGVQLKTRQIGIVDASCTKIIKSRKITKIKINKTHRWAAGEPRVHAKNIKQKQHTDAAFDFRPSRRAVMQREDEMEEECFLLAGLRVDSSLRYDLILDEGSKDHLIVKNSRHGSILTVTDVVRI